MANTTKPLIALTKKGALEIQPGYRYRFQDGGMDNGGVSEMTHEMLEKLEPALVEKHLSTLSKKDKQVFMNKYNALNERMKQVALTQMLSKYPEIGYAAMKRGEGAGISQEDVGDSDSGEYQLGGPLSNPSLRDYYQPQQASTLQVAQRPLQQANYNQMFLDFATPTLNQAASLRAQGQYDAAAALRQEVLNANQMRADLEVAQNNTRLYRKGGELSAAKAEKMLHDGTIRGKKITDRQRRYFAAVAYGKKQSGGAIEINPAHKGRFTALAKRHGMGVQTFAKHVLSSTEDYSASVVQQANFARNAKKFKHQNGGTTGWNPILPPTEGGWQYESISSNRPVKANTVDVAANPQGVRSAHSPSGKETIKIPPVVKPTNTPQAVESVVINYKKPEPPVNPSSTSQYVTQVSGKIPVVLGSLTRSWRAADNTRPLSTHTHISQGEYPNIPDPFYPYYQFSK